LSCKKRFVLKEELEGIGESERRLEELARKSGMPMTRREYEKRKAEREKAQKKR